MNTGFERASALSPHDWMLLDQWGRQLEEAFDAIPYQVGSTVRGATYRDVDVRMVAPTDWLTTSSTCLAAINLAVTLWGQRTTGLPIDFQFQPADEFHSHDRERRNPLGISTRMRVQTERERRLALSIDEEATDA